MFRPLIGVTTLGRNELGRFEVSAEYVVAIRRAGGIAVLVPPGEPHVAELLERLDGFVLSGGGDIQPALYGGAAHAAIDRVDVERDAMELECVRRVVERGVPTLCICRGAQVLNVALGGTLIEHLPDVVGEGTAHQGPRNQPPRHPIRVEPGSHLAGVMNATEVLPQSRHHQAAREVAPSLRVVGRALDGTIEALEMPSHPWLLAVQWHPESTAGEDATQQRLFDELVHTARVRRDS